MSDEVPIPQDWNDRRAVERWLRTQPRDAIVTFAARAALRAIPLVVDALYADSATMRGAIVLPTFRAASAAWFAAVGPSQDAEGGVARAAANAYQTEVVAFGADLADGFARADAVARAAASAARAAAADALAATAARATANAAAAAAADAFATAAARAFANAAAAASYDPDARADALSASAARADAGANADVQRVALLPLWLTDLPSFATRALDRLRAHLLAAGEGWEVWTDWYARRLAGGPVDLDLERLFVEIEDDLWAQGPAAVNAEIARRIAAHRHSLADRLVQDPRGAIFTERDGRLAIAPGTPGVDQRAIAMQPRAVEVLQRLAAATRSSNQFAALGETATRLADLVALSPDAAAARSFELWSLSGELAQWRTRDEAAKAGPDGFVEAMPSDLRQALDTAVPAAALYARSFEDVRGYDDELAAYEGAVASTATQRAVLDAARQTDAIDPNDADIVDTVVARGGEEGPQATKARRGGWFTVRNMVVAAAGIAATGLITGYTKEIGAGLATAHDAPARVGRFLERSGDALDDLMRGAPDDVRQAVESVRAWLRGQSGP